MWTTLQLYAVWLVLVGVVAGSVARRHRRDDLVRFDAAAEFREFSRHRRWRRRRLRGRRTPIGSPA